MICILRSLFVLLFLFSASSSSIACESVELSKGPFQLVTRLSVEYKVGSCDVKESRAIAVSGTISRLANKTAYTLSVKFFSKNGGGVGTYAGTTYIGSAKSVNLDEYFLVPSGARQAVFFIKVESRRPSDKSTELLNGRVHSVLPVSIRPKDGYVSYVGDTVEWLLSSHDEAVEVPTNVVLRDIDGKIISSGHFLIPANVGRTTVRFDDVPAGYYSLEVHFSSAGSRSVRIVSSFAVFNLKLTEVRDPRFGLDAALSWYGGNDKEIGLALDLMKKAGVGSVRDRLSWAQVNPHRGQFEWGRYLDVSRMTSAAGFDVATVFHDSPAWTRPDDHDVLRNDKKPPIVNDAVREFGVRFSEDMGPFVKYIEYWNEQNSDFFRGVPFQYASGLKEFASGLKESGSNVSVLLGAPTGPAGAFFNELYSNNVSGFVDGVSIHYYQNPEKFHSFYSEAFLNGYLRYSSEAPASWVTETGAPVFLDESGAFFKSEIDQSVYLAKAFVELLSSGQERVFYFFLRDLIEPEFGIWGILRRDFSPRPAYVTLGSLTRHLSGAGFAGVVRDRKFSVFYFKKSDESSYRAVAWGEGNIQKLLGSYRMLMDRFGREVHEVELSSEPIFIVGIESIPKVAAVAEKRLLSSRNAPRWRLASKLKIDGVEFGSVGENKVSVPIGDGSTVALHGVVENSTPIDSLRVLCSSSVGLVLNGPQFSVLKESADGRKYFECSYGADLAVTGHSFIMAELMSKGEVVDRAKVLLKPDINIFAKRVPQSSAGVKRCLNWLVRSSASVGVTLKNESRGATGCLLSSFVSRQTKGGDAWVFPYTKVDLPLDSFRGVSVEVKRVGTTSLPPKNFVLQLVDKSGGIWLLDLKAQEFGGMRTYVGLFSLATPAPWKPGSKKTLPLSEVNEVMFGWGGYAGKPGDVFGFSIGAVEFLH